MAIQVHGPDWPSVRALRADLANVPENGRFQAGGIKHNATEQLARFRANDIRTVEYTNNRTIAESWVRQGWTVFARRENHTQGRDIVVASPYQRITKRWRNRDWWSRFTPSNREWRIHIFDGSSIARGCKVYNPVAAGVPAVEPPLIAIRSRRRGWILDHTPKPPTEVRDAAKAAVDALGYLYGAVDILETVVDGPVVLEVNRLPAMDDYTRGKYVEAIRAYVRKQTVAAPAWYEGCEVA